MATRRSRELSSFSRRVIFVSELSSFFTQPELEIQNGDNFWTACTPPLFKLPTPDPELSQLVYARVESLKRSAPARSLARFRLPAPYLPGHGELKEPVAGGVLSGLTKSPGPLDVPVDTLASLDGTICGDWVHLRALV